MKFVWHSNCFMLCPPTVHRSKAHFISWCHNFLLLYCSHHQTFMDQYNCPARHELLLPKVNFVGGMHNAAALQKTVKL